MNKRTGPAKIRAIFFDLGNVLVRFDASIAARKLAKAIGMTIPDIWRWALSSDLEKAYTKGRVSSHEFYREIKRRFPNRLTFRQFSNIWNNIFSENKGMERLISALAKHYPLYLISNTNELHFNYIKRKFPILRHFQKCFPSHEVGHRKPEAAIFKHALRSARKKSAESIFIDDIAEFVRAARKVGMRAIQFKSPKRLGKELRRLGILI